jgi:hypothetical protein
VKRSEADQALNRRVLKDPWETSRERPRAAPVVASGYAAREISERKAVHPTSLPR